MADSETPSTPSGPKINIMLCLAILYVPAVVLKRRTNLANISNRVKVAMVFLFASLLMYTVITLFMKTFNIWDKKVNKLVDVTGEVEQEFQRVQLLERQLAVNIRQQEDDLYGLEL